MSGANGDGAEILDGTAVEENTPVAPEVGALVATGGSNVAVTPQVEAEELVQRLAVIKDAMEQAMQRDVDYGVIPGTDKPALYKPGSEKLSVLFQLDVQLVNEKIWGPDEHLTVISRGTAFHAPSGTRLGYGEGLCTTREKKYAKRKQERVCPSCGIAAVIKGKAEYGGGWLCWKKRDGCNAKFRDDDPQIIAQEVGEVPNPDLPDLWNTVVKMAEKRARVDVVLAVTGASALFTQDIEDGASSPDEERPSEAKSAQPPRPKLDAEIVNRLGKGIGALSLSYRDIGLMFGALGANNLTEESGEGLRVALEGLTLDQSVAMEAELEKIAQDAAATASQGSDS